MRLQCVTFYGYEGGSSSGAGSSGTNEGVNSEGTSTTVSGENQASNASNKKNRGGLDKNREVEGRSAVSVEQDHEERKDEEVGEKVRREVLAARLLQAEDRERQLRQTLDVSYQRPVESCMLEAVHMFTLTCSVGHIGCLLSFAPRGVCVVCPGVIPRGFDEMIP